MAILSTAAGCGRIFYHASASRDGSVDAADARPADALGLDSGASDARTADGGPPAGNCPDVLPADCSTDCCLGAFVFDLEVGYAFEPVRIEARLSTDLSTVCTPSATVYGPMGAVVDQLPATYDRAGMPELDLLASCLETYGREEISHGALVSGSPWTSDVTYHQMPEGALIDRVEISVRSFESMPSDMPPQVSAHAIFDWHLYGTVP